MKDRNALRIPTAFFGKGYVKCERQLPRMGFLSEWLIDPPIPAAADIYAHKIHYDDRRTHLYQLEDVYKEVENHLRHQVQHRIDAYGIQITIRTNEMDNGVALLDYFVAILKFGKQCHKRALPYSYLWAKIVLGDGLLTHAKEAMYALYEYADGVLYHTRFQYANNQDGRPHFWLCAFQACIFSSPNKLIADRNIDLDPMSSDEPDLDTLPTPMKIPQVHADRLKLAMKRIARRAEHSNSSIGEYTFEMDALPSLPFVHAVLSPISTIPSTYITLRFTPSDNPLDQDVIREVGNYIFKSWGHLAKLELPKCLVTTRLKDSVVDLKKPQEGVWVFCDDAKMYRKGVAPVKLSLRGTKDEPREKIPVIRSDVELNKLWEF